MPAQRPPDRLAFVVASVVCLALAPAFVSGVPVVYPAVVAALALLVLFAVRRRSVLTPRLVPWGALAFAAGMFVVVGLAGRWGLTGLLTGLLPVGAGRSAVFALGASAGVAANTVDNLPAFVALGAVAGDHPHRIAAVLIGTNVAPLITPWASLANLLWHQRCARAGVTIRWSSFAWRGAVVSVLATSASLAVLTWR